jgi:hypothetical protein
MYYIDIPTPDCVGNDDGSWTNLAQCDTKAEAVAWIREHVGECDDDGNICLLTYGGDA